VAREPCPSDPSEPAEAPVRAAAVTYRRTGRGPEFLLVRTKNGRAWTFPKGHVEAGETPVQAAAREAREEAGATGEISVSPFTRYAYPGGKRKLRPRKTDCVEAYLLRVEAIGDRDTAEHVRDPEWVDPERAAAMLVEHREERWANEHRRLLGEALRAIERA
jgi:8-oxo-dGTP pyrophosphatase MutT (NUDIX family)